MNKENIKIRFRSIFKNVFTLRMLISVSIGAVAGYLYYRLVGCSSGSCAITSNPVNSILYGTLVGAVMGYKEKERKPNS